MQRPNAHARINAYIKKGNKFFEDMHPMPGAFELWNYIKDCDPIILSSTGRFSNAKPEKLAWIKKTSW